MIEVCHLPSKPIELAISSTPEYPSTRVIKNLSHKQNTSTLFPIVKTILFTQDPQPISEVQQEVSQLLQLSKPLPRITKWLKMTLEMKEHLN